MPANRSQALWHADPVHMDAATPFDGTSFFFSLPSADARATPDKQCCYDCCLDWACCMGNRLSLAPARWSAGTPEHSALAQQAQGFQEISATWRRLRTNSIWIPLVSQTTFAEAAPNTSWWFDDARWGTLLYNWGVAAAAAQNSSATQLFIDAEEYCQYCPPGGGTCHEASSLTEISNCTLFYYPDLLLFSNRSFAEYEAIARQRGTQLLLAVAAVWPALQEVSLTHGLHRAPV